MTHVMSYHIYMSLSNPHICSRNFFNIFATIYFKSFVYWRHNTPLLKQHFTTLLFVCLVTSTKAIILILNFYIWSQRCKTKRHLGFYVIHILQWEIFLQSLFCVIVQTSQVKSKYLVTEWCIIFINDAGSIDKYRSSLYLSKNIRGFSMTSNMAAVVVSF